MHQTSQASVKNLQLKSLGLQVEAALKEEITAGRLRPGEFVSIADLSRQFGTSVTPVRDAIQRLSAIGFVEVSPRKEIRVASLSAKKLKDVFEIRIALEGLAVRTAAANAPEAELNRAWQILSDAESKYRASGKSEDLLPQDTLVHDLIRQHCDNAMLISLMQGLQDWSQWARQTVVRYQPQAVSKALPEHKEILAAMRARSGEDAQKALVNHLHNTLERTLPYLKSASVESTN